MLTPDLTTYEKVLRQLLSLFHRREMGTFENLNVYVIANHGIEKDGDFSPRNESFDILHAASAVKC